MAVIQIRKAVREGARVLIQLAGNTGSGKTVTAIHLAYGLANYDASKVGFLDTENRRGSLNADVLERATRPTTEPFLIGDLYAPFSPARYVEAIHEFQRAGVEVLVVDSGSHEWEGNGGCNDIAEADRGMWNRAKKEHKRFMSALLQTDMHIIICVRAREKDKPTKQIIDGREKTVYEHLGLQPIQEKNFLFEATASLMMYEEGTVQVPIKLPNALRSVLGRGKGYISADDGYAIRQWLDGAKQVDQTVEKFRNRLISVTEQGVAYIKEAWAKTPKQIQDALGVEFYEMIVKSAESHEADRQAAESAESTPAKTDPQAKNLEAAIAKSAADAPPVAVAQKQVKEQPAVTPAAPAEADDTPLEDASEQEQPSEQPATPPPAAPTPPARPAAKTPTPPTKPTTAATQERKLPTTPSTPTKPPAQPVSRPAPPKDEPMF